MWHFAEGNAGGFDTYWTFVNPNTTAATAEVYYRHENGVVYAEWLTLPATARTTRLIGGPP